MKKIVIGAVLGIFLVCLSCATGNGSRLSVSEVAGLIKTLPRHSSFRYLNARSLGEPYFEEAARAGDDPAVYIVLSDTRSAAGKLIGLFTGHKYTHISLAFDRELETLVSYNSGYGIQNPGLNRERPEDLLLTGESSFAVFRLPVTAGQKGIMAERIRRIDQEGSSYNLLGVVFKRSFKPNIMYCSQFVQALLEEAGAEFIGMESARVKPMDFVLLDRERRLIPLYEEGRKNNIFFPETIDSRITSVYDIIR